MVPVTGGGTIRHRTVDRAVVDQMIHASDKFQVYLAIEVGLLGAVAGVAITLTAGVTHPTGLYSALGIGGTLSILMGILTGLEWVAVRKQRALLDEASSELSFTVTVGESPATPSASGFDPTT